MDRSNFKTGKTDANIIGCIVAVPIAMIMIFALYNMFVSKRSGKDYYLESKNVISRHGIIDSIFRQGYNHNILTLRINGKNLFEVLPEWETKFLVGDSISKKEGELFVEHYRDGKLIEILDYHDIAKDMR